MGNRGNAKWVRDARYATSGKEFDYTYNQYGQKASETNLNGVVTNYTYGDDWGNLTQVVQDYGAGKLNRTTQMSYDVAGHMLQSTDPMAQSSSFSYNSLGQPLSASFPARDSALAETVSYTYGANGRAETVTDNRGTTTMTYENGCDRVHSVSDPVTGTTSYTYGRMGERRSVTLPGGGTWHYSYELPMNGGYDPQYACLPKDDPDSVTLVLGSITDDQGRKVEYQMDNIGQMRSVRYNKTYDQYNNLVGYCQTDYTYDTTPNDSSLSRQWLSRLRTTWNFSGQYGPQQRVLSQNDYTYDNNGNRLTNTISTQTLNQDGTPATNEDGSPQLTSRTEQYGYDEISRLTSVDYGDGGTQSYTFDDMGNRLSKTDSASGTEGYSYNAANMLLSKAGSPYTNDLDGNTLTGGVWGNT